MNTNRGTIELWKKWVMFIITGIVIVITLPRDSIYHFDFQKGKEWKHDDIVTAFDFPIYKSDAELSVEKNEVLASAQPYFVKDIYIEHQQLRDFSQEFESKFGDGFQSEKQAVLSLLSVVYQRGIVDKTNISQANVNTAQTVVSVLTNNVAEEYPLSEIFSTTEAYNYVVNKFRKDKAWFIKEGLVSQINLHDFIKTNLSYDAVITEKVKELALENISLTKGIVKQGTKIISQNEIVNTEKSQILDSYVKEFNRQKTYTRDFWLLLLGQILFVAMCLFILYLLLKWYQPEVLERSQNIIFLFTIVIISIICSMQVLDNGLTIYLVPLTVVPIYISSFFRSRTAMFVFLTILLLIAYFVPNSFEFIVISFVAGIASVAEFRTWYHRGRLFTSLGLILLTYVGSYIIMCCLQNGSFDEVKLSILLAFVVNVLIILFAYQLIYVFEKIFGFLSNSTLMELADTNRLLLRELAEKAPGTFQHSLQVSNIAEEIIHQLDGDSLLVRAGALYHDIGKLSNPQYFVENQVLSEPSPHDKLAPEESAKIIVKHVEDGVALAKKHQLPSEIIDFIRTHHATSQVRYFLSEYKEQHPDATDFSMFSYPGPNPFTKEQAVLMISDSVEAAARTLPKYTDETISNLVEAIVNYQVESGYLEDADLTFRELSLAKEVLKSKLQNIHHARIEYPKDEEE